MADQYAEGGNDFATGAAPLEEFLRGAGSLNRDERLTIVNQAIALLEGFYVHLPLKRAMHAVDPLQRLRLLRRRIDQLGGETRFHAEMTAIFTSVRDLHTNYLLPAPYAGVAASLPFRIETCVEDGKTVYLAIVSPSVTMPDPAFRTGVAVTHWNGVPIERAVANAADRHAGANIPARLSRGLAGLTQRPLVIAPPPDEEWVVVGFADLGGTAREARFPWHVTGLPAGIGEGDLVTQAEGAMGFDLETMLVQDLRREMFAPKVAAVRKEIVAAAAVEGATEESFVEGTDSTMPHIFTARPVTTAAGTYGYIRIWTFAADNNDDERFVNEFVRLLALMPQDGLILDVRDNGGGLIYAGERLLQTLTPRTIEPERVQFINTPLTELLTQTHGAASPIPLDPWAPSVARAVETGAVFSAGIPITPPARCNDIGQCYRGPVVLVTSARCYSTTDFFAAGFQDHGIGPVLGVDSNTGAGGANVWTHDLLLRLLGQNMDRDRPLAGSPLRRLPKNSGMRVAIRRSVRVGNEAGTELEDLGVTPDHPHQMTRRDVLEGNLDLLEKAGSLLAGRPRVRLDASAAPVAGGKIRVTLTTAGIDRLDLALGGRPQLSVDTGDGGRAIDLPGSAAHGTVTVTGFRSGVLVASTRAAF